MSQPHKFDVHEIALLSAVPVHDHSLEKRLFFVVSPSDRPLFSVSPFAQKIVAWGDTGTDERLESVSFPSLFERVRNKSSERLRCLKDAANRRQTLDPKKQPSPRFFGFATQLLHESFPDWFP